MAKKAKKGNGRAKVAAKPEQPKEAATKVKSGEPMRDQGSNRQAPDLDVLRKPVLAAKAKLDAAEAEAKQLAEKAQVLVTEAKQTHHEALAPYREACRKAGVDCEFPGGLSTPV